MRPVHLNLDSALAEAASKEAIRLRHESVQEFIRELIRKACKMPVEVGKPDLAIARRRKAHEAVMRKRKG